MKKKNTYLFLVFLIGSIYLILFKKKSIENFFYTFSYSLVLTFDFINRHITSIQEFFTPKETYLKQIELLKQTNINLLGEILHLKKISSTLDKKDYIRYKSLHYKRPALKAKILLKRINPQEHILIIDRGQVHGVEKNLPVVFKNFLIGKILNVYLHHSEVILITDARLKISVLFSSSKAHGIAHGQNNKDNLAIDYIEEFETLKENSGIYTSGEGLVFPEGFFLGELQELYKENELYAHGKIKLPFNITDLKKCFILANLETDSFKIQEPCLCSMDSLWNMESEFSELIQIYKEYQPIETQNLEIKKHVNQNSPSIIDTPLSDFEPSKIQTKKNLLVAEEKPMKKKKLPVKALEENKQEIPVPEETLSMKEVVDQDPKIEEINVPQIPADELEVLPEETLPQNI
jgi:rod shape-determining protein MreC